MTTDIQTEALSISMMRRINAQPFHFRLHDEERNNVLKALPPMPKSPELKLATKFCFQNQRSVIHDEQNRLIPNEDKSFVAIH